LILRSSEEKFDDDAYVFPPGWQCLSAIWNGPLTFLNKDNEFSAKILSLSRKDLPDDLFSDNPDMVRLGLKVVIANRHFALAFVLLSLILRPSRLEAIHDNFPEQYRDLSVACDLEANARSIIVLRVQRSYEQEVVEMNSKGIMRTELTYSTKPSGLNLPNGRSLEWPKDPTAWVTAEKE
jgi:hypothetical protein